MRQSVFNRKILLSMGGTALALVLSASAVNAQVVTDNQPVANKQQGQRPGEGAVADEPVFTRAGSFLFTPSIEVGATYDDNIFVEPSNEVSDLIFTIKPRLDFNTNLPRHGIKGHIGADIGLFLDHFDTDNYYDWDLGLEGILDVTRVWKVKLGGWYRDKHEPRGEDESTGGPNIPLEPVDYSVFNIYAASSARFSRVILRTKLSYQENDYDDAETLAGNFEQDDRDRSTIMAEAQMVFDLFETYRPFIEVTYANIDYDHQDSGVYAVEFDDPNDDNDDPDLTDSFDTDFIGVNRDGHQYTVEVGVEVDLTGTLFGELKAGYVKRTFDDHEPFVYTNLDGNMDPQEVTLNAPNLTDIDGPRFYGALTWLPDQLSSIDLIAQRDVGETTLPGSAGFVTTDVLLAGQYEVQRNWTLGAHIGYTWRDYEIESGPNREDELLRLGVGTTYDINRNFSFNARYEYWNRDSNFNTWDYTRNITAVTFKAKL